MITLGSQMQGLLEPQSLKADTYLDTATNLLYCKKCRTPRQKRFEVCGKIYTPLCLCACLTREAEAREARQKRRDFLDRVAKNRSLGLPEPELRKHTFANDLGFNPAQMALARQYVENFEENAREGRGLLLWGYVGTGKSYIAGCIANALLDRGVEVLMTNFSRLLNRLTDFSAGDKNAYIDSLNAYRLLIVDDLGVERSSQFVQEQVFQIVDSRYRRGLPMIVTTNLPLRELQDPGDVARDRIYNRLLERCTPIQVNKENLRARLSRARKPCFTPGGACAMIDEKRAGRNGENG